MGKPENTYFKMAKKDDPESLYISEIYIPTYMLEQTIKKAIYKPLEDMEAVKQELTRICQEHASGETKLLPPLTEQLT